MVHCLRHNHQYKGAVCNNSFITPSAGLYSIKLTHSTTAWNSVSICTACFKNRLSQFGTNLISADASKEHR